MKVLLLIGVPLLFVDSFDLTTPRHLFAPRALQRTTAPLQKAKPSESESNSFLFSSPGDLRYLTKEEDGRAKLKSEMLGNGDERSIAGGFHQVDRDEASEILGWDATRLSEELESGEITATALMNLTLARIDELNPTLNAIILLRHRDELLEQARIADASPRKGWLHGIPTAIKDLSNIRRLPTTMGGSPLYPDFVPSDSDPFVDRLLEAGCIVIGKTNAPESGLGSHTFNDRWGTTFNPYSTQNSAGGSSGGAAVALSARMLAFADGSDMMGSLRNPAGWNNVYSIRPTAGLIEPDTTDGNLLPYPISTVGPMARSPRDLARLLETMAGSDRFLDGLCGRREFKYYHDSLAW
jgi:Asp-tRNA(Asn)/Glu-tRNA(Gln) amidotransferase A subunit family amidase